MGRELITVAEVDPFPARADALMTEDERHELIAFVARHPERGSVIPGTGGLRKLRWASRGGGKRGGMRVVYYFYNQDWPVFLLTIYRKSQQEDLSPDQKKRFRALLQILKQEMKARKSARR